MKRFLIIAISLILITSCSDISRLQLSNIISNGMVLQQSSQVTFWGTAIPGSQIKVTTDWDMSVSATAKPDSTWSLEIATPRTDGQLHQITISAVDTSIVINDVMFGEVWLAAGQSNMEIPLSGWGNDTIEGATETIRNANDNAIRFFSVSHKASLSEVKDIEGNWKSCTPENASDFSAVAYYYASMMHDSLNVPIGIIETAWGGSPIESWIGESQLTKEPDFHDFIGRIPNMRRNILAYSDYIKSKNTFLLDSLKSIDFNTDYVVSGNADVSKWSKIFLPTYWEDSENFGDFDGTIWFVRDVEIPSSWIGKSLTLSLGAIDDYDNTFVNGILIGSNYGINAYKEPRKYKVPARCVTRTNMTIVVLVTDIGGKGGFATNDNNMYLQLNDKNRISLLGEWRYCVAGELINGEIATFNVPEGEFENHEHLREVVTKNTPTAIYNGMLKPISQYKVSGVIWYQGEANVGRANQYQRLSVDLIDSFRDLYSNNNRRLPIIIAQLAPYGFGNEMGTDAANLREAQRRSVKERDNCYIISTMDVGSRETMHPCNKRVVGQRFAYQALKNVYNINGIVNEGPTIKEISETSPLLVITFDNADGLYVDFSKPNNFEIAGDDGEFFEATVFVKDNTLTLFSHAIEHPTQVCYGYKNYSEATLFNGAGLPACSFSTEQLYGK